MQRVDSVVHDFATSLEKSHTLNNESDWVAFYRRIWPDAATIVRVDKASKIQTRGIDRMVWLASGKQILIDEKCRERDYGDILLETCSVLREGGNEIYEEAIGWALDNSKHCDFVAYAIPSAKKCYMLPFELTKAALIENLEKWKNTPNWYPKDAQNNGYVTRSVAVPWKVLGSAIAQQMQRRFGSEMKLPQLETTTDKTQLTFVW